MNNFQVTVVRELKLYFAPLVAAANSREECVEFFHGLGWYLENMVPNGDVDAFIAKISLLPQTVAALDAWTTTPPASWEDWRAVLTQVTAAADIVRTLRQGVLNVTAANVELFVSDLFQGLSILYVSRRLPQLYVALAFVGAIESDPFAVLTASGGVILSERGRVPRFNVTKLKQFLQDPWPTLKEKYWVATGLSQKLAAKQVAEYMFPIVGGILEAVGFSVYYDPAYQYDAPSPPIEALAARLLTASRSYTLTTPLVEQVDFGFSLGLLSREDLVDLLPASSPPTADDAGLLVVPFGSAQLSFPVGPWVITLGGDTAVPGLVFSKKRVSLLDPATSFQGTLSVTADYAGDYPLKIGSTNATRFEIGSLQLGGFFQLGGGHFDYGVQAALTSSALVVTGGDGDGFLKKIFPDDKRIPLDLLVGWKQSTGFFVNARGGFEHRIEFPASNESLLAIREVVLGLSFGTGDRLEVVGLVSGGLNLGPVHLTVSRMGLAAALQLPGSATSTTPFGFRFTPPAGVGIKVNSDAITGGGYLYLDAANHKYAGVAQLKFRDKLNLNAIGILQTQLPNNQPGYSLLLLITAQFSPVQLGMGFTLNGVGGVVGLNRHLDTTFLLGLVRGGGLDQLLFPANVLDNPTAALATVEGSFPVMANQYVFGLMAKIGWGTPTLITLDVALLIELPDPVRLAILGIVRAILPDLDHPILRLRADFLGTIDFASQRIAFDATLHDSGILMFDLSGDLAFRLYQGSNPVFVLTAGGFHPAFQPPANANLPTLRRLTLALASGSDFRLTLASYFAVTSNTVQFGSRLDLYVHLFSKCTLEGYLYLDALFQFNPFRLDVRLGGGVAIKWDGDDELAISLNLALTGPGPWHVWGEAEFDLFGFSYTHDIDETFGGGGATQPALADVNVRALLQGALADKRNWEMYVSGYAAASPVVLRPAEDSANLLIDPRGILTFTQRLVPLGYSLERYGNARPTQGNRFDITSVTLGTGAAQLVLQPLSAASPLTGLVDTKDFFSPGQYRQLTDGQKLSSPSFQLMTNGFQLFGPQDYASGPAAVRGVEYEVIVLPATAVGLTLAEWLLRADQEAVAGETAARPLPAGPVDLPAESLAGNSRLVLGADTFQQLVRNSAIERVYAREEPSLRAPDQVVWQEDEYTVVYAANLARYQAASPRYGSEAEATAFLREQLGAAPWLAGELLVVPAYQLAL